MNLKHINGDQMEKRKSLKQVLTGVIFAVSAQSALAVPTAGDVQTFKNSCTLCHTNYLNPAREVDWTKVAANANAINARLDWANQPDSLKMPPVSSDQYSNLASDTAALESLRTAIRAELSATSSLPLSELNLPAGFSVGIYASARGARSLTLGKDGTVYVGTRGSTVYEIKDFNKDGVADSVKSILTGLTSPNGVAYLNGDLYVAENEVLSKYSNIDNGLGPQRSELRNFVVGGTHQWKYLAIGPDNKLYVTNGAPCNICNITRSSVYGEPASIQRMNLDGSNLEDFARGVRNSVGFTFHPETNDMWFTDNGRDNMYRATAANPTANDLTPNDKLLMTSLNQKQHWGYPFCHWHKTDADIEGDGTINYLGEFLKNFGQDPQDRTINVANLNCNTAGYTRPKLGLTPHGASLGLRFYTGNMFPAEFKNRIFIAERGSWNATDVKGARVMEVTIDENNDVISYKVFMDGFLKNRVKRGRPVDVLVMPDGALLVSDDTAGVIYRITYAE